MKQTTAAFLGWLLAAAAATTIGLLAVSLLTGSLTNQSMAPLSRDAVAKALTSSTPRPGHEPAEPTEPVSAEPTPTDSATKDDTREKSSSPPAELAVTTRSLSSPGGTAIAQCTGTTTLLLSWSPAQGYAVEEHVRGPAASTLIQFDGEDQAVTVTVTCPAGEPVAAVVITDD